MKMKKKQQQKKKGEKRYCVAEVKKGREGF